jgi:competence protein ComEC
MNQAPLLRLIFPFIAGIISAVYLQVYSVFLPLILIFLFIVISIIVFSGWTGKEYKKRWIFGASLNIFLFFSGYQLTLLKTEKLNPAHFSNFTTSGFAYVKVLRPYLEKEKTLKVPVEVISVLINGKRQDVQGKLMLYIAKDSTSMKIKYGDGLFINADYKEVLSPQNPAEFDYKKYLAFHNIYQQAYVAAGNWKFSGNNEGNFLLANSIKLRDKLLDVFERNHVRGDEFAVGSALLLGYEDKLDADIISAYSGTGALHVLSVSGMHVAIVYMVFFYLLSFLDKIKRGNIIKAACLLLFVWFYAALTGLSPSVLRAAAMLSFVIVGQAFKFQSNIYNTLAASAFLLLIINPYLIMEVGFQLSYLAVFGIVFIHPLIYEKLELDNWLLEKIWAITSISIAAQLATFPLGLHYFHQFPNYFLFSNLVVIPLSGIIIYLGIFLLAVANFTGLALFAGQCFSILIAWLNSSVRFIEQLPNALLEGISISVLETWLIYSVMAFFFAFILIKKQKFLILSLSLFCCMLLLQAFEKIEQAKQEKFIVYNIPGVSAYDFIKGKRNLLLADSAFLNNSSSMLFHVKHNWWENGIHKNEIHALCNKINSAGDDFLCNLPFLQKGNVKVALINKNSDLPDIRRNKIQIDYVILANNTTEKISRIAAAFNFKKLIFDSSNSAWKIKKWKDECLRSGVDFYSVSQQGAFVASIQ